MKIKNLFKRIKCELMYRKATAAADKAAGKHGGVFFVLPMQSGKLMVINKQQYAEFKKRKLAPKDAKVKDLYHDCVYHTRCFSKKGRDGKKRKFLRWKGFNG